MKITNLPADLRMQVEAKLDHLTADLKALTKLEKEHRESLNREGELEKQYLVKQRADDVTPALAKEMADIRAEHDLIVPQTQRRAKKVETAAQDLARRFHHVGAAIYLACQSLRTQAEERFLAGAGGFYRTAQAARAAAANSDEVAAVEEWLTRQKYPPIGMTEPDRIRAYAETVRATLRAILDGSDVMTFTGYTHEAAPQLTAL